MKTGRARCNSFYKEVVVVGTYILTNHILISYFREPACACAAYLGSLHVWSFMELQRSDILYDDILYE